MNLKFKNPIRHIVVIYRSKNSKTKCTIQEIQKFLKTKKVSSQFLSQKDIHTQQMIEGDLILSLGGDGTYLKAVKSNSKIPILGINMGSLGFLTPHEMENTVSLLDKTLKGMMFYKKNPFLETQLYVSPITKYTSKDLPEIIKNTSCINTFNSINDIVIERGSLSHLISLSIYINKQYIYSLKSDGLIISSAIGSTAYNLAAGGPILHPETQSLVITPICSHSLTNRPIVINDQSEVIIQLHYKRGYLTIDGENKKKLLPQDLLLIKKTKTHFISLTENKDTEFFLLRKKLQFGQRN